MNIHCEDYRIDYDAAADTVRFAGTLRLNGAADYAPISDLLDRALEQQQTGTLIWDLSGLEFLNSSGINMLYQFVIKARRHGGVAMQVIGSDTIPWQRKSLTNMSRFMPGLKLEMR